MKLAYQRAATRFTSCKHKALLSNKEMPNINFTSLPPTGFHLNTGKYILDPGLSTSRTMWVMPALYPRNAVRWMGLLGSSFGKLFTLPRWRRLRLRGRKPKDPCLGAENLRWDWKEIHYYSVGSCGKIMPSPSLSNQGSC